MKENILKATAEIIAQKGIKSASTRAICQKLNITAPTLYHYFVSKSKLVEAVTEFSFQAHIESIHWNANEEDLIHPIRSVWDQYMDFAIHKSDLYRVMMSSVVRGEILDSGYNCFMQLSRAFEKVGMANLSCPPLKAAQIYLSTAQGLALTLLSQGSISHEEKLYLSRKSRDAILTDLIIERHSASA